MTKNITCFLFSLCLGLVYPSYSQEVPANDSFTIRFDYGGLDSLTFPNRHDIRIIHDHLDYLHLQSNNLKWNSIRQGREPKVLVFFLQEQNQHYAP